MKKIAIKEKSSLCRITRTIEIRVDSDRQTDEVLRAGKWGSVNAGIAKKNFPMRIKARGRVLLAIVELRDHRPETPPETTIKEAQKLGLSRPLYEHVFYFGEQHPEEVRATGKIFFLHQPIKGQVIIPAKGVTGNELCLESFQRNLGTFAKYAFFLDGATDTIY